LRQCSLAVQKFIHEMEEEGLKASQTTEERQLACAAIAAALLPHAPADGATRRTLPKNAKMALFAEQIKMLRKQKGLTQDELANKVGVRQSAISMMESAQCRPQPATLMKLAKQLGTSPDQLWPKATVAQPANATNGTPSGKQAASGR
jgi:DNA-binding XRE family transcriptional regulator